MCPVVHRRSTNQILEKTIQKNKTALCINYISGLSAVCDSTELTVNCREISEILIRLQLGVWTLRDAQSHRFDLSSQYVDVTGVQEKHIPVTKPLKKRSLNTCEILQRRQLCFRSFSHTFWRCGRGRWALFLGFWRSSDRRCSRSCRTLIWVWTRPLSQWQSHRCRAATETQDDDQNTGHNRKHKLLKGNNCPLELIFRCIFYLHKGIFTI